MATQKTCLIAAGSAEAARDLALEHTSSGDHVFFALPTASSAADLADEFRTRDPLAASAATEAGALALVNLAIMAHGRMDCLLVELEVASAEVLAVDPGEALAAHIQWPWELLRAAAPFLRRNQGCVRLLVRGTGPLAECTTDVLATLAKAASAESGLSITCSRA
jgi:hypothetical protein